MFFPGKITRRRKRILRKKGYEESRNRRRM
jgi:hypothetical protein